VNLKSKSSNSSRSQGTSGFLIHFISSIFAAAFNQWQQLVMFLSPYVENLRSLPKRIFSEYVLPIVEYTYNTLHDKFTNYTFSKFVADVVEVGLTIVLLPLTITVGILRGIRNKSLNSCTMCCDAGTGACTSVKNIISFSHEMANWLISTPKRVVTWSKTTFTEVRSGDITWKEACNDMLDCIKAELGNGCEYFGENSTFTYVVRTCKIGTILKWLRLECESGKKEE